jgi:hypothetical protein
MKKTLLTLMFVFWILFFFVLCCFSFLSYEYDFQCHGKALQSIETLKKKCKSDPVWNEWYLANNNVLDEVFNLPNILNFNRSLSLKVFIGLQLLLILLITNQMLLKFKINIFPWQSYLCRNIFYVLCHHLLIVLLVIVFNLYFFHISSKSRQIEKVTLSLLNISSKLDNSNKDLINYKIENTGLVSFSKSLNLNAGMYTFVYIAILFNLYLFLSYYCFIIFKSMMRSKKWNNRV